MCAKLTFAIQNHAAISLKRSSLEPKLLQSVLDRNSYTTYRLVTNLETWDELWPTFPGRKIFPQQISRTLLPKRDEIWVTHYCGHSSV